MTLASRLLRWVLVLVFAALALACVAAVVAYWYIVPRLPDIEQLQDVQYSVPLRIFSRDGLLMAEFGEQRRSTIRYEDLPKTAIQAILATEDDRFFEHPGIDYQGLVRAGLELLKTGEKRQGGSTITMQVARNFFLSREKTYLRKVREIFLALKIEHSLSKEQILELYLNKIYFGQRAYGIAAAASVYYGLPLNDVSVAQMAMIAGLPKAPSANNPISNPGRAIERRNYVLKRMYVLGYINSETYLAALKEVDNAELHSAATDVDAAYVAEMVRNDLYAKYGEEIYSRGFRVTTTIDSRLQDIANRATRSALLDYDSRHGYRGPEAHVELAVDADETAWREALASNKKIADFPPALVVEVGERSATVYLAESGTLKLDWSGLSWAQPYESPNWRGKTPEKAGDILKRGDIVRIAPAGDKQRGWRLTQIPLVEGALVSMSPDDGAVLALTGGFDFFKSKFNRAIQAQRQPGSSFKPFVYSAALDKGYTTASIFNDAPVVLNDPSLETTWRPENYSGKFYGPTRLREALTHSRNLVSIRLLQAIGPAYAAHYSERFGFPSSQLPRNLSLALGAGTATPMQMARGYSVFANGGSLVEPYYIKEVTDSESQALFTANPAAACRDCDQEPDIRLATGEAGGVEIVEKDKTTTADNGTRTAPQVISSDNAYLMTSMMRDVIRRGTGAKARSLGRDDLAGKTGTTNDQRDAWFCGYSAHLVTTVWVGFDQVEQLGNGETGAKAALPMWIAYMGEALKGVPQELAPAPADLVTLRIDPDNGLLLPPDATGGIDEIFSEENQPAEYSERFSRATGTDAGATTGEEPEPLF